MTKIAEQVVVEGTPGNAPPEPAPETRADPADDLTQLPLRRAFRDTAERILAARRTTGRPVSLLIIDVDHFKLVNDTYGHLQGDDVLRMVAEQVGAKRGRSTIRPAMRATSS